MKTCKAKFQYNIFTNTYIYLKIFIETFWFCFKVLFSFFIINIKNKYYNNECVNRPTKELYGCA